MPDHVTITLLKKAMILAPYPVILLDGFPSSMHQTELVGDSLMSCSLRSLKRLNFSEASRLMSVRFILRTCRSKRACAGVTGSSSLTCRRLKPSPG